MKKINEMTDEEILALTPKDIDFLYRLVLAEEGISIPKKPELGPLNKIPARTKIAYYIDALRYHVASAKAAKEISAIIERHKAEFLNDSYNRNYSHKYVEFLGPDYQEGVSKIEERMFYDKDEIAQIDDLVRENKEMQDSFDLKMTAYNDAIQKAHHIRIEIEQIQKDMIEKYAILDFYVEKFKEYLILAEDSVSIAVKFMNKAHNLTNDEWSYVRGKCSFDIETDVEAGKVF